MNTEKVYYLSSKIIKTQINISCHFNFVRTHINEHFFLDETEYEYSGSEEEEEERDVGEPRYISLPYTHRDVVVKTPITD